MNRRLLAPAAAVLALGGFLAACGDDDDMSREEIISELQETAGLTEEQANCVYDSFGDDANEFLNQDADDADDDDIARLTDAMSECVIGEVTIPDITMPDLGDITIPDITMPDLDGITIPDVENS